MVFQVLLELSQIVGRRLGPNHKNGKPQHTGKCHQICTQVLCMHIVALNIHCCQVANLEKATGAFVFPGRPSGRCPASADPGSIWLEHLPRERPCRITETKGAGISVSGPPWKLKGSTHVIHISNDPCQDPKVSIGQPGLGSLSSQGRRRIPRRYGMHTIKAKAYKFMIKSFPKQKRCRFSEERTVSQSNLLKATSQSTRC